MGGLNSLKLAIDMKTERKVKWPAGLPADCLLNVNCLFAC